MRLDISRLRGLRDEEHLDRTYPIDAFGLDGEDFRLIEPVSLVADVRRDGRTVHLTGQLKARLETACGRCLEPFAVPVDVQLALRFLPAPADPAPEKAQADEVEDEISEDDLGVSHYQDEALDLGEMMREQFILAQPMKPLCRPDCAGLCPVCGINRNREQCTCQTAWVDPRMEPLARLKNRQ